MVCFIFLLPLSTKLLENWSQMTCLGPLGSSEWTSSQMIPDVSSCSCHLLLLRLRRPAGSDWEPEQVLPVFQLTLGARTLTMTVRGYSLGSAVVVV